MSQLHSRESISRYAILGIVAAGLGSVALGLCVPVFLDAISGLRAAIMFPMLAVCLGAAIVFGSRLLLYSLAFVWFIPIITGGVRFIPITASTTGWELLLWLAMLVALASGVIRLIRPAPGSPPRSDFPVHGIWVGLAAVTISSLLAVGRVSQAGYGEFRYATINILCLMILANRLILDEKQLERWILWFLGGAAGLLIYQIGFGGYEFVNGRLIVHMVSLLDVDIVALPNKIAILASSCAPFALCVAIGGRLRGLRLSASVLYAVLLIVIFLTFSRAQMIAVTIASAIVLLLSWRSSPGAVISLLVILIVTGVGAFRWLLYGVLQSIDARGISEISYRLESFFSFFVGDQSLAGRFDLVRLSFSFLSEQPFGIGYGRIANLTGHWEHNLFMAVMNGSGLVGLAGLLLFFVTYTLAAFKALGTSTGFVRWVCIAAVGSIATMAINGLSCELICPTYPESSLIAIAIGLAAITVARNRHSV
jgi:hypothetical protein